MTIDEATYAQLGGTPYGRNIISGNRANGISLTRFSSASTIADNYVGTDMTGTQPLPNAADGIGIQNCSNNTIGGTLLDDANLIAFNGRDGIRIDLGTNNAVRGNAIYGHDAGLGIELTNGGNHNRSSQS